MNQKSINYLMRFVLHGHHYTYRDCQMIESLAQLYGNHGMYNGGREGQIASNN